VIFFFYFPDPRKIIMFSHLKIKLKIYFVAAGSRFRQISSYIRYSVTDVRENRENTDGACQFHSIFSSLSKRRYLLLPCLTRCVMRTCVLKIYKSQYKETAERQAANRAQTDTRGYHNIICTIIILCSTVANCNCPRITLQSTTTL